MTGRLKRYSSAGNILSKNNNNENNNSFLCINTKRTINPSYSVCINDEKRKKGKKQHKLSSKNNKSSSVINPEYFNPLINYKNEEKKEKKKIRRNYITNKDHFVNMMPTQFYKYKSHIKPSMYNHYLNSQIDYLPGSKPPLLGKIAIKRSGKKLFKDKLVEESKDNYSRNEYYNKDMNNYYKKSDNLTKVYEFDNPIISDKNMNPKNNHIY